jgi:hypothetical protein
MPATAWSTRPRPSAPVAQFVATPTTGVAPLAVVFADQSTNSPTSWSWTFGDGGTSALQRPSHTYAAVGTYTYAYPTNAKLRFMCDASDDSDDVYIDEIVFRGYTSGSALAGETKMAVAEPSMPAAFALAPNHPNPFNPATTIAFTLPAASHVVVKFFDIKGRVIETLTDAQYGPGTHSLRWDAARFASGTYFYRIDAGENVAVRKMTLLK